MTEALTAVIEHAFTTMGLHRLEANVMPRNEASKGLLVKLGFHDEGIAKRYLQIQGRWEDHTHMVMLREEWEESKNTCRG
jgi:ribosomal-protein-alanine N-acetyltransferase